MKNLYFVLILCLVLAQTATNLWAQNDSSSMQTTQNALFNRPFIGSVNSTSIGGYAEANTNYFVTDGLTDGFSMEARRFNLFVYSAISSRIKLLAELEFEHGTSEIALESAFMDFEIDPILTLRGGIILAPIGAFNQRHDSPLYEFIERPLVSTEIIPSTLTEVGFGINGKKFIGEQFIATYDAYIVNGLRDGIIDNTENRTYLPAGKSADMLGASHNGIPFITGRAALRHRQYGELGFSAYTGIYNSYRLDGQIVDAKRRLTLMAIDYSLQAFGASIQGEAAFTNVDVPTSLRELYATKQMGIYTDITYPLLQFTMLDYSTTALVLALRGEYIDFNNGTFSDGSAIADDITALSIGVSLRPTAQTTLRVNYRNHWVNDILGNPIRTAGIQCGFATYF